MTFDRAAARARCQAATPGPWYFGAGDRTYGRAFDLDEELLFVAADDAREVPVAVVTEHLMDGMDAVFIAHARTDLPAALDALDEIERDRDHWRDAVIAQQEGHVAMTRLRDLDAAWFDLERSNIVYPCSEDAWATRYLDLLEHAVRVIRMGENGLDPYLRAFFADALDQEIGGET